MSDFTTRYLSQQQGDDAILASLNRPDFLLTFGKVSPGNLDKLSNLCFRATAFLTTASDAEFQTVLNFIQSTTPPRGMHLTFFFNRESTKIWERSSQLAMVASSNPSVKQLKVEVERLVVSDDILAFLSLEAFNKKVPSSVVRFLGSMDFFPAHGSNVLQKIQQLDECLASFSKVHSGFSGLKVETDIIDREFASQLVQALGESTAIPKLSNLDIIFHGSLSAEAAQLIAEYFSQLVAADPGFSQVRIQDLHKDVFFCELEPANASLVFGGSFSELMKDFSKLGGLRWLETLQLRGPACTLKCIEASSPAMTKEAAMCFFVALEGSTSVTEVNITSGSGAIPSGSGTMSDHFSILDAFAVSLPRIKHLTKATFWTNAWYQRGDVYVDPLLKEKLHHGMENNHSLEYLKIHPAILGEEFEHYCGRNKGRKVREALSDGSLSLALVPFALKRAVHYKCSNETLATAAETHKLFGECLHLAGLFQTQDVDIPTPAP